MANNYKDLIIELEIHTNFRDSFESIRKYWIKQMNKGCPRDLKPQDYSNLDMPRGSSNDMTLDRIVKYIRHYESLAEVETDIIRLMKENLQRINTLIINGDSLYNKVAYLKYQKDEDGHKKYTLENIAEMLVYSVDRIKQISAQV
ncbi:MAG TPA: hypothetical protein VMV86_01560 [Methanosarcinales archaeon]|nr:hypothetical protein [Methanosarcinales archaeon]